MKGKRQYEDDNPYKNNRKEQVLRKVKQVEEPYCLMNSHRKRSSYETEKMEMERMRMDRIIQLNPITIVK